MNPAAPVSRILASLIDSVISFIPILGWIYFFIKDALFDGRSVGKKLIGIKVVTEDGASLAGNWGASIIRNVIFIVPLIVFVELFLICTDKEARRLGDKIGKTRVIQG